MRFFWLLYFLLCFLPQSAFADVNRLAVLEFIGVNVPDNSILALLSDGVRTGLIDKIDTNYYLVMTRESTLQILKDMGKDASCMTGECEIEVGRNIGADFVVSGNVTFYADTYIVTLKLHDTATSALLSTSLYENKNPLELIKIMPSLGEYLMEKGKFISGRGSSSSSPSTLQEGFSGGRNETWNAEKREEIIVFFESSPSGEGTVVMVDGHMVCTKTPCSKSISIGRHQISMQKERYQSWTEAVTIQKGSIVKGTLNPDFGKIQVESNVSGVSFVLDKTQRLTSPSGLQEIAKGEHHLVLDDKCYTGEKGEEYGFSINAGEEKKISFPVVSRPAGLNVLVSDGDGNDIAAKVYVDEVYLGDSPSTFTIGVCSQEIKVEAEGKSAVEKLALKEKNTSSVSLTLGNKSTSSVKILSRNGYDSVLIPSGSFLIGCTTGDSDCDSYEKPVQQVTISKPFYMMTTEVTQGLFEKVMGNNPSEFHGCGKNCPLEQVSWYDAVRFANKLSEQEGLTSCYQIGSGNSPSVSWSLKSCNGWRLPTEAEWEYAARGGESYKYAGSNNMDEVGWYSGNSSSKTHPVGQKQPNKFGLYDMSGNVWEWVWDSAVLDINYNLTGPSIYSSSPQTDPIVDITSPNRVCRGGSWHDFVEVNRVSNRNSRNASNRYFIIGFRLLRTIS